VKRIAELFTERATDLAALITKEMGKRPSQAVGEAAGLLILRHQCPPANSLCPAASTSPTFSRKAIKSWVLRGQPHVRRC
jgi:acyl-CoA reductase-like NAD-dependent aldehyde dehydrogenase